MQRGINTVGAWITEKADNLKNLSDVMAENDALKKQVDELTSELNTNNLEQYELENLRELLALDQKYPSYEKVAANVIGKSSGNWFSYFTIDKGTDDGIEVDMNVIAGSGLGRHCHGRRSELCQSHFHYQRYGAGQRYGDDNLRQPDRKRKSPEHE